MTRQRDAVAAALGECAEFTSAQEIHARMRAAGASVGLTTVYRALAALAEAGQVDVLRTDDGETAYRRCATESHHHHLVCRGCGRTVEVAGPDVEQWAERVAREHGFGDVTHTLEVFGTCGACGT